MSDVPTMFKERSQSDRPFFFRSAAFFSYEVMIELGSRVYHTRLPELRTSNSILVRRRFFTSRHFLAGPLYTCTHPKDTIHTVVCGVQRCSLNLSCLCSGSSLSPLGAPRGA